MKTRWILLLALLFVVVSACGGNEPGPTPERAPDSVPERAEVWLHVEGMTKVQGIT